MSRPRRARVSGFARLIRKSFVSTFVVVTYVAYALHERFASPTASALAQAPQPEQPSSTLNQADPEQGQSSNQLAQAAPTQNQADPEQGQSSSQLAQAAPTQNQANPQAGRLAQPTVQPTPVPPLPSQGQYKNGTYTGVRANAFYGQVQVQVVIQNGKIANVTFLDYPKDRRTSVRINSYAIPYLQTEAIQAQSANVNVISGATLTSDAFMTSLQTALSNARG